MISSLEFLATPQAATRWCIEKRHQGNTVGYIPTMGALHAGHQSLIKKAQRENDVTCVSIFVNPLQFNNKNDLDNYPINLEKDLRLLEKIGCDMVYTGTLQQFFPEVDTNEQTIPYLNPGPHAAGLEGDYRPSHLAGVATIVTRLFQTVGQCHSYFGEKDFQQCLVVQDVAKHLRSSNAFIDIVVCPTVRESSGLALSSRNARLDEKQKQLATTLYQTLIKAKSAWCQNNHDAVKIQQLMRTSLQHSDIEIEYVAVRDSCNWTAQTPIQPIQYPRGLIAAKIAGVRLIDNMSLMD